MIVVISATSLYWFRYCIFDFGLNKVSDIYSNVDLDCDDISDVQDNCDDISYDGDYYIDPENFCEDFCDNVDNIKEGSDAMITLTSFTLVLLLVNIILVLIRACKQRFRPKCVPIVIGGLSAALYALGFIIYMSIANFDSFEDCENDDICEDFEVYGGIILSGLVMITMVIIQIYGFITTRKAYF